MAVDKEFLYKYGAYKSSLPEFKVYLGIKQRLFNPNRKSYKDYGGRGIGMSPEWVDSFEKFYLDMGPRPTPKHTVERLDNDGDYCPDNCAWLERSKQNSNQRRSKRVTLKGKDLTLKEGCEISGVSYWTARDRFDGGVAPEDIFSRRNRGLRLLTYKGETLSMAEWCRRLKLNYVTVRQRLNAYGWSVERAFETPNAGRGANGTTY